MDRAKEDIIADQEFNWVIVGAESIGGHPGRECKLEWIENIVKQCKAAGVPCFVKQIHMWRSAINKSLFFETEQEAKLHIGEHKPKRVLLKYPRDKDLFPKSVQVWEYPNRKELK